MSNYNTLVGKLKNNKKDSHKNDTPSHVYFQYIGSNWLIAIGPATKTYYRFDWPGAVVAVDHRDQESLEIIPQLQQLYGFKTSEEDLSMVS
jgi:hypothetical protein